MSQDFFAELPLKFTEVILGAYREEGNLWIERLPEIIGEIEENWSLKAWKPFQNLSYHYVSPCVLTDGSEAVLKIGFPGDSRTVFSEIKILKFLGGKGAVKLLRFDEKRFCFLLEKLVPGENLKTIYQNEPSEAVKTAIEVMRKFWQNPPENHNFPTLEKWFEGFIEAEKINFAPNYVKKARMFFDELTANSKQQTLLHGDFHHENILSAEREPFLAIDPKGIVGDIGYDISVFLINQANWLKTESNLKGKLDFTILQFAEGFEIEPQNLRKWVFAHSVLSAWWTFEENCENWRDELAFTEIWGSL
ncbi:MAG TPA: aminoglycoside phosphotransferase family protein [Pyrinomonadaceae bacterium]|nr:aminoglycoside phosphotransferase family protein [Pyrinomonadaceae bacterium]